MEVTSQPDNSIGPPRDAETGVRNNQIVKALEEDVIFGRLAPGTRITEDALLARFSVTRHYVRQGLVELEQLGIVVREHNKGASVRKLTPTEVREIYALRELLQRQAALWIPLPAPSALIDALSAVHDDYCRHVEAGALREVHEANDRFHLMLFGACGNEYMVRAIEHHMQLSLLVRANSMSDRRRLDTSREHHRMMIEMLRGNDNWVLAQLCVEHLQPSKREYLDRLEHRG